MAMNGALHTGASIHLLNRLFGRRVAQFREDLTQAALLAAVQFGDRELKTEEEWRHLQNLVTREARKVLRDLGIRDPRLNPVDILRRRSERLTAKAKASHMRACGKPYKEIAEETGLKLSTARAYGAGKNPATGKREMLDAARRGARARWGDSTERRAKAREMRDAGATLQQIAALCGYKSASGAMYAIKKKG